MFNTSLRLISKLKSLINFDEHKKFLFRIEVHSYSLIKFIQTKVIDNFSLSKRVYNDDVLNEDDNELFYAGKGLHVCKFENCWAILEITIPDNVGDEIQRALYVLPWDRKHILGDLRAVLPVRKGFTRLEIRNKKRNQLTSLNPDFGKREQFVSEEIYKQVDEVIQSMVYGREEYVKANKAYKETILLYGPHGTGKSTLIRHFAAKYGLSLIKCDAEMILDCYMPLESEKPGIILVEDFDSAVFLCKDQSNKVVENDIDYGDFINWLDGVQPLDNVIIFLTTNHIEKIIESVIRGGRVNQKIYMPLLIPDELCNFFEPKWHTKIKSYKQGDITISMIPDLRNAKNEEEFDNLVKILS